MTDPVAVLKARRAKILADAQREAETLDADAHELERLQAIAEKYGLTLTDKTQAAAPGDVVPIVRKAMRVQREPAYRAAINASENALKAANGPLELSQLFDACKSLGVPLAGKRPQSTLSAYLAHEASSVVSIRRGIYWLKGVPLPKGAPERTNKAGHAT